MSRELYQLSYRPHKSLKSILFMCSIRVKHKLFTTYACHNEKTPIKCYQSIGVAIVFRSISEAFP